MGFMADVAGAIISAIRQSGPSIAIVGANADQAHDAMHALGIEHHAFHNFNGMDFVDAGEFGIMARGSNKVTIPLHGYAAKDIPGVAAKLQAYNPSWKISY